MSRNRETKPLRFTICREKFRKTELCLEAIRQNGHVIKYMKDPKNEMYAEAIRKNPKVWNYLQNDQPRESVKNICKQSKLNNKNNKTIFFGSV